MEPHHLRMVLQRWFPGETLSITRAGAGVSTPVFRVDVADAFFWARSGERAGERRDGEAAAHRLLFDRGVPVPAVVRYEATPHELDRSLALTSHIPGVPLATMEPGPWLALLAAEVGRVLARINRTPVRGFGWAFADAADGVPVGVHPSRAAWVEEYRDACEEVCLSGLFDASTSRVVREACGQWLDMPDDHSGWLAHGDFDASHIYVDPVSGTLTGVIDFGELRSADPFYDLGHLLLHDGESRQPALFPDILRGYHDVLPLPANAMDAIRTQALVIGSRALVIQLRRSHAPYRDWLVDRIAGLASMPDRPWSSR